MRVYYKTYHRCDTDKIFGAFGRELMAATFTFNGLLQTDGTYAAVPGWFTQVNGFPLTDVFWIMTPPSETNTHYMFSWTVEDLLGEETEYIVELFMDAVCSFTAGCEGRNSTLISWLTREGGWGAITFNGKTTFEVTVPEAESYMQSDRVKRVARREGVYRGELLTTGSIPEEALDLLESLKYSTQVYKIVPGEIENAQDVIPVYVMDGDFTKRKTGEKIFDVGVRIIYAEELQMQSG